MSVVAPPKTRLATVGSLAVHRLSELLARHSIAILRISLGLVFLGFAIPKYFPGISPAEPLVVKTLGTLSFGIVGPTAALVITAVLETFIGLTLITGRLLIVGLVVMAGAMLGIMSPIVLFAGEMFAGGPTLEAQYVLKDVVLLAGGLVVAATALGAQLVPKRRP